MSFSVKTPGCLRSHVSSFRGPETLAEQGGYRLDTRHTNKSLCKAMRDVADPLQSQGHGLDATQGKGTVIGRCADSEIRKLAANTRINVEIAERHRTKQQVRMSPYILRQGFGDHVEIMITERFPRRWGTLNWRFRYPAASLWAAPMRFTLCSNGDVGWYLPALTYPPACRA